MNLKCFYKRINLILRSFEDSRKSVFEDFHMVLSTKKHIILTVTSDIVSDQRMDRICSSLANNNYQVTIICRKTSSTELLPKPYKVIRMNNFFRSGKLFYIEHNIKLLFLLLFKRFDSVCAIDLDTLVPAFLIGSLKRKPIVYDAHEYFTEVIEVISRPKIQKLWKAIEAWIVPKLSYAYTVSQSIADLYKKEYGTHFELIRNIAVLEDDDIHTNKDCDLIYIGAVNAGRGLEEIIEAIKDTNVTLKVCGNGDVFDKIKKEVKNNNLEQQVQLLGFVPPHELKKITKTARIGILILEKQSLSYYYSLANKFFDYTHAELPQILIDFPEYRILNKEFEVAVLTPNTTTEIKSAISKLLADDELYNRLKNNTKQAKRVWNWQNEEKTLLNFYSTIFA